MTAVPSAVPTDTPTSAPTDVPTTTPTGEPTAEPTPGPTAAPTPFPRVLPTLTPTTAPTAGPTRSPPTLVPPPPNPVPLQYRFPMLVCGTHLPVPSAAAMAALATGFRDCAATQCWLGAPDSLNALADRVFAEPRVALLGSNDSASYGNVNFTVLCSFFGNALGSLEYVNCGYTLNVTSSVLSEADDGCSMAGQGEEGATRIFGPNKANFSIELQEVSGVNFPQRYAAAGYNATEMLAIRVGETRVLPGGERFRGLIEGFDRERMLQDGGSPCPEQLGF